MSVSSAEYTLKRARSELDSARKKQAAEDRKVADAEKAAASKQRRAERASTESSRRSYQREADSKRDRANRARSAAAAFSQKVADAQQKVSKAEAELTKAQAAERKKLDAKAERDRKKRESDERRQRDMANRAAEHADRERQRANEERDWRISELGSAVVDVRGEALATRAALSARPWEQAPSRITILVLTAEPNGENRLRIEREIREIQEQVRSSDLRDSIQFEYRPATRLGDLIQHLNETEPEVIHFSGHGDASGIALHDENDHVRDLTNDELDRLLTVAPKPLKLVVFNSCNSAAQARVASKHAAAAIGMQQSIADEAARVFAGQLYNSLGFGRSLGLAMQQATLYVEMKLNRTSGEPTLVMADGLDANDLILVNPSENAGA
jgi:hypothetical protein